MSYEWLTSLSLAKLLIAFMLCFVYLPARLLPQDSAPLSERFQQNLILMVWLTIIMVHLLALAKIYSIVLLLLLFTSLFVVLQLTRHPEPPIRVLEATWRRGVVWVLDLADGRAKLLQLLTDQARATSDALRGRLRDPGRRIHLALFLLILFAAGFLRFSDAFESAVTTFSDPYTHLLWMKELKANLLYNGEGVNQFYPRGFHAFAAVLDGLTALDGAMAMRLVGPLVGTLLVVGVYFVGRKLTDNPDAALVGMFFYGVLIGPLNLLYSVQLFTEGGLLVSSGDPAWFPRQTAALSFEFAMLFLMPTLFAAQAYLQKPRFRYLLLSGAGTMILAMSNLGVASVSGIGFLLALTMAPILQAKSWRARVWLIVVVLGAVFLGTLQYFYATLFSDNVDAAVQRTATWMAGYPEKLPYTLELLLSGSVGLILFLSGLLGYPRGVRNTWWRNLGALLIILAFLSRMSNWGYAYLLPPDRIDIIRIFLFCGALSAIYQMALQPLRSRDRSAHGRPLHQVVLTIGIIAGTWWQIQFPLPKGPRYEYEALARVTFDIKRNFPPLQWTVVSLTEDFSKIFQDKGWHMNAANFLDRYNPYAEKLDLPTPYVFLFVERRPYGQSSDPGLNAPNVRRDIERRLQEWTAVYGLMHKNMSTYLKDWDITVYLIAPQSSAIPKPTY